MIKIVCDPIKNTPNFGLGVLQSCTDLSFI
jgi:hypothetical protein